LEAWFGESVPALLSFRIAMDAVSLAQDVMDQMIDAMIDEDLGRKIAHPTDP